MRKYKFIELEIFINDPKLSHYEFAISNQSHIGNEFGENGSNKWIHNGFELRSISGPDASDITNRLFTWGQNSTTNNTHLIIKAYTTTPISVHTAINTWFNNMMNAVKAYNNYYSGLMRTNILHK